MSTRFRKINVARRQEEGATAASRARPGEGETDESEPVAASDRDRRCIT